MDRGRKKDEKKDEKKGTEEGGWRENKKIMEVKKEKKRI